MMMMMMMMVIFEVSNERLPVHCLPLLATASPSYFKSVDQVMVVMMMVVMMVMMEVIRWMVKKSKLTKWRTICSCDALKLTCFQI